MMKTAGIYIDSAEMLSEGRSALDIMKESMDKGTPLALSGCSTDAMMYYIGIGSPVIAMVEDDMAVLIIGYDNNNLLIYDPRDGSTGKKGIKDSTDWFATNGNRFLTYAR